MLNIEFLKRLRPDSTIYFNEDYSIKSLSNFEILLKSKEVIDLNVLSIEKLALLIQDDSENKELGLQLSNFINSTTEKLGLLLLKSKYLKGKQIRGTYVFLLRFNREEFSLEFFNLLLLSNQILDLFSMNIWQEFNKIIINNRHNFISKQLYLAYKSLLPLFLLSYSKEHNFQAKPKYEFGELLFNFNTFSNHLDIGATSGRNILTGIERSNRKVFNEGLKKSESDLFQKIKLIDAYHKRFIIGNVIANSCFVEI